MRLVLACVLWVSATVSAETFPAIFEAQQQSIISAERSGILTKLPVKLGQRVKARQTLAQIAVEELNSELAANRVKLRYANEQLDNFRKLDRAGLATHDDLAKAKLERDLAYTNIKHLKYLIARSTIRAPFAGVVQEVVVNQHQWIKEGDPILQLVNPYSLKVRANIPTHLAVQLEYKQQHEFVVPALGGIKVKATLTAKAPAADERSRSMVVIWKVVKPPKGLAPGLQSELTLAAP